jgi:hypothetical protein
MARLLPTPRMSQKSCPCSSSLLPPSPPGGSRSQLSHRWADHLTIEPSSLQLQRWGAGGPVEGCRIVEGNFGTRQYVPAEDYQLAKVSEQHTVFQVVKSLPALEDSMLRTAPGRRELYPHPTMPA